MIQTSKPTPEDTIFVSAPRRSLQSAARPGATGASRARLRGGPSRRDGQLEVTGPGCAGGPAALSEEPAPDLRWGPARCRGSGAAAPWLPGYADLERRAVELLHIQRQKREDDSESEEIDDDGDEEDDERRAFHDR